ncbi:STAS domain-containing protein [Streptomyces sp. NPDC047028]|uniref:STAS domain-containing protein n=1 Tax=Streptomyces sp. NPDC047028 TaxID=3155793 RepID=UPI00340E3166
MTTAITANPLKTPCTPQPSGARPRQVNVILAGPRPMSSARHRGLPDVDARTPPVLVLPGPDPLAADEVAGWCAAVRELVGGGGVVVCDVGAVRAPALGVVEVLARLELAARRGGGRIRLRAPAPGLLALLDLVGLRLEVEGQVEEGKPALGVEETVETGDTAL